jgi:hypothetical protein
LSRENQVQEEIDAVTMQNLSIENQVQEEIYAVTILERRCRKRQLQLWHLSRENQIQGKIAAVTVHEQREPGARRDICSYNT